MANKRKEKALRNVAGILTSRPKMVGQLSSTTLDQVPLSEANPGLSITVRNEQRKRATTAAGDSSHAYRTKRPKR